MKEIRLGLTFQDVLLVPKYSKVSTRKQVDVSTNLTKKIRMHIPIVASNMDTVCEAEMAIHMARMGGIGIIHRFLPIEDQAKEVEKVKRAESIIIERPYTTTPTATVKEATEIMHLHNVSGLIVTQNNKVQGILTERDIQFATPDTKVAKVMTPKERLVTAPPTISIEEAQDIMYQKRVEKLPLVDSNNVLQGLITVQDILKKKENPISTKDKKGRLATGAAVGVKGDFLKRTEALIEVGTDVIVVDIAHGHSELAINTVKKIKKNYDIEVIAGNVATKEGTADLIAAGADGIKVGVGPGSICITRIVAGAGVPQLTAIWDSAEAARPQGVPIIADGGIRTSGDVTKALMAGADSVMIGSLLAGTTESPGLPILRNGKRYKVIRGMASLGATLGREAKEKKGSFDESDVEGVVPEGVEALVPFKGTAKDVVNQLVGGLKSGISYCGGLSIEEARKNAEFIRITPAGFKESKPHDVEVV
ncbi:MAG: IMP dehydrogenase [Methanobacteriota archaeon]|nr:MAG: IMP dehydrogenase [Euryarchaeota archaeon]